MRGPGQIAVFSAALALALPFAAHAATTDSADTAGSSGAAPAASGQASEGKGAPSLSPTERPIVVTADRAIISALQGIEPDSSYDEADIQAYAVSTVGEVVDEIRSDNADANPTILVNGQPAGKGSVSGYPAEAIERVDLLPRGTAQKVGGATGERTYNIVLKDRFSSAIASAAHKVATEGGWNEDLGEVILTHIRGQDRANLSFRVTDSGLLTEAERGITAPADFYPFDPLGNIIPDFANAEIDPALSALAGRPVVLAAVPVGVTSPSLADFAAGAGIANRTDQGPYRSLRGADRNYTLTFDATKQLTPWLNVNLTSIFNWNRDNGLAGLPETLFALPAGQPGSPFGTNVLLALSDPSRPLAQNSKFDSSNISLDFNANLGAWFATFGASYSAQANDFVIERVADAALFDPIVIDPAVNPFAAGNLASLAAGIPVVADTSNGITRQSQVNANVTGPLFKLPAGAVQLRGGFTASWSTFDSAGSSVGAPAYSRNQQALSGGITVPLTSRVANVLGGLGNTELTFDWSRIWLSDRASLDTTGWGLNWQLAKWLRITANLNQARQPVDPELLAGPITTFDNVRVYDPLREETVDVTYITGGNALLVPQKTTQKRIALNLQPLPRQQLQLQVGYSATDTSDQVGSLPPASVAVLNAFPERFLRNAEGRLIEVDSRSVNFAGGKREELNYSIGLMIPLYHQPSAEELASGAAKPPEPGTPRPRIQINFSHVIALTDTVEIRSGLPIIDLLAGGAIGFGGGRPRHTISGSIKYSDRGTGITFSGKWRSASSLTLGTLAAPQRLDFSAFATFDIKLYVDTGRLFGMGWTKGSRISLSVSNIFDTRQQVTDLGGFTPLSYRQAYRDPIGRTISLELRKKF